MNESRSDRHQQTDSDRQQTEQQIKTDSEQQTHSRQNQPNNIRCRTRQNQMDAEPDVTNIAKQPNSFNTDTNTNTNPTREYHRRERETSRDEPLGIKDSVRGRHWKRHSRIAPRGAEDDLSEPYNEESTTPFTCRINEFIFPKRIRMPTTMKTYDGTGDQEDHVKTFTIAARVKR
ncbi:hypothetical protein Tco_0031710 [Tanacetum coccineum]